MHAKQLGLLMAFALASSALAQQATVTPPEPKPMQPVARDANSCLWQGEVDVTNADGSIALAPNSYLELATGLNYFDATSGQWVPASEQINLLPNGGAIAHQAQHQVQFPADIGAGDILLTMPDGAVLQTHPAGLAYFDGNKSVLIAQLTNSIGLLLGNTVTYTNCLVGPNFSASVRMTFTKAGLEQEVILADQPPDAPDAFGLDDSNSFLLVLTQFTNAPAPALATRQVTRAGLNADDDSVDWPSMSFGQGHSFLIGSNTPPVPSTKTWQNLDHAPYLIEQTPYILLNQLWQALPKPQAALTPRRSLPIASLGLPRPPHRHLARANANTHPSAIKRLAQNAAPSGLSLDYIILNTSLTNYTFASSQTYFISAPIYLYSSATFEPAVIKFTNNASINFEATSFSLTNKATAYAPILFLSKDDNSAGASITSSTGNPTNLYANPAINIDDSPISSLAHFRIACAKQAISVQQAGPIFYDGQIVNCSNGIASAEGGASLRNVLVAFVTNVFSSLAYCTVDAENCTFAGPGGSGVLFVPNSYPFNLHFTNCLFDSLQLSSPASGEICDGATNGFSDCFIITSFGTAPINNNANPFQHGGAGNYYLTSGSSFRNAGAPMVDPTLIAGASHATATAPVIYTNKTFSSATVFGPIAPRENPNAPDLGYAYDALDYLCCGLGGPSLVLTNGAAMGFFGASGIGTGANAITFASYGRPQAMNHLCWYPSVQEQPIQFNGVATPSSPLFSVGAASPDNITLNFTQISLQGSQQNFFDSCTVANEPNVTLQNCQGANINMVVSAVEQNVSDPGASVFLFNNVFTRSIVQLFGGYYLGSGDYNPLVLGFYNNLFWNGSLKLVEATNASGWYINDNLFFTCTNYFTSYGALDLSGDDNAYYNTLTNVLPDSHPFVLTNALFDPGPFSSWYSDSNTLSTLINAGSRTAAAAGLTNFTLFTNLNSSHAEIPDTGTVDIGYHLTAVASNGYPIGCQSITNANTCLFDPFLTFSVSSPIFSLTNGAATNTCTATTTVNDGFAEGVIVGCDGSIDITTNIALTATILSNWVTVYWSTNTYTFKGTLTWKLTNTFGGFGTNVFHTKFSSTGPCGTTFTNSYSNTFTVANWITPLAQGSDLFGTGIDSSPALSPDGKTVYIESTGNMVYAINVTNGAIIANYSLTTAGGEIDSSPTVAANGSVYAGSVDGAIYAFTAGLGLTWSNTLGAFPDDTGVYGTPAITANGTLYGPTDEGPLDDGTTNSGFWSFRANPSAGPTNWLFKPQDLFYGNNGDVESSPAIAPDGTIYFLAEGSRLYALATNGNVKWFIPVGGHTEPDSSPAIGADGTIYVGSSSAYFYAVNPDGSLKWTFAAMNETDSNGLETVIYSSPAIASNGTAYFATGIPWTSRTGDSLEPNFFGVLYAVTNGVDVWAYTNLNGEIASSPALASDGTIYVGAQKHLNVGTTNVTANGALLAVTNGSLKWSVTLPAEVVSSPVITSNGTVIFGCEDGNVYAIAGSSGLSTSAPWPMFHHDPQHTGCMPSVPNTNNSTPPFPNNGMFVATSFPTPFAFSLVGPANSEWSVLAATNLVDLRTSASNLGTLRLDATGLGGFTDVFVTNLSSKFYYLKSNAWSSLVIGYTIFNLPSSNSMISDPFIEVNDTDYANPNSGGAPVNTIGTLFSQDNNSFPNDQFSVGTTVSGWLGAKLATDIISDGSVWSPNSDLPVRPGEGVVVSNAALAPTVQWVIGDVRTVVTNQISPGTNYLASPLPISGKITSDLELTGLSSNDTLSIWITNGLVTYTNTGSGWNPSEPTIGLCQGFILNCATSHLWIQTNLP